MYGRGEPIGEVRSACFAPSSVCHAGWKDGQHLRGWKAKEGGRSEDICCLAGLEIVLNATADPASCQQLAAPPQAGAKHWRLFLDLATRQSHGRQSIALTVPNTPSAMSLQNTSEMDDLRRTMARERLNASWKQVAPEHDSTPTMSYSQEKLAYYPPAPGTTPTKFRRNSGEFVKFADRAIQLKENLGGRDTGPSPGKSSPLAKGEGAAGTGSQRGSQQGSRVATPSGGSVTGDLGVAPSPVASPAAAPPPAPEGGTA